MKVVLEEVLRALPPAVAPLAERVIAAAERRRRAIHLVGGPVRDFLLGRPIRDADLVVETGEGVEAETLARDAAGPDARLAPHGRFGTVVLEEGEATLDIATARRESYAHAGALPQVEPGSLEEDLRRRDFSVNALAIPLSQAPKGGAVEVIDCGTGLRDLEARRLRVLHAKSFSDDPTRALRAARLAPRLGFTLVRSSRAALRDAIRDGAFGAVSGDRLRRELVKLFDDASLGLDPALALRRLADWDVLPALEPGLALPAQAVAPLRRVGRITASPPWRGPRFRAWAVGLAVWLAPLSPALRRRALRRFSVRGELAVRIAGFPGRLEAWLDALATARGRGAVDAVLGGIDEEQLLALYVSAPAPARRRILRWAEQDRYRRLPINGDDLVAAGLSGPVVGRALDRVRAAYLDGAVASREDAVALALEVARQRQRPRPTRRSARSRR